MNFVAARSSDKRVSIKRVRDAFLDLSIDHKRMLKMSTTSFIEIDGSLYVIGDDALASANLFNKEIRRPLAGGVVSSGEVEAQKVIAIIINNLIGKPRSSNEKCCFSIPAPAIDVVGSNTIYHTSILKKIIQEAGYEPEPVNEALAIIYSEGSSTKFSGLGISYGSGMTNICLSYNAMSALEFSLGRGGDWIDAGASSALGITASKACHIKESGIDILNPEGREAEAISFYISNLIEYTIEKTISQFHKAKSEFLLSTPIPIIVSGGTSMASGFMEKFTQIFESKKSKFPIQISGIRQASDPMHAVALGLHTASQMVD
jgi:hypothetical protein